MNNEEFRVNDGWCLMVRGFYFSLVLLGVVVLVALVHAYTYDRSKMDGSLSVVAEMVHGVVPALETSYIEPDAMELFGSRVRANPIYPEMSQINRMGFVYAK